MVARRETSGLKRVNYRALKERKMFMTAKIYYARLPEDWRKEQKYKFLEEKQHIYNIEWQEITPDAKHNWLTEGMHDEFETFIPLGTKEAKAAKTAEVETIFKTYSNGLATARDVWAYNFDYKTLVENINRFIDFYDEQVFKWTRSDKQKKIDEFVAYDTAKIAWSEGLKNNLKAGKTVSFEESKMRMSLYRPFTKQYLYFDRIINERVYVFPSIFPTLKSEHENQTISVGLYGRKAFSALASDKITNLNFYGDPQQSFPFYVYSEDGANRRENVTDWALRKFREDYKDDQITKRDIFHYVYAVLHHPVYRAKYAANLKRELPRVPFAPDFWAFAEAGDRLAALHVNYESQTPFPLEQVENPDAEFSLRVEKMRLSKDKTELRYNDFLTLKNIPPAVYEYRLGNRSALEWIVEQYQVSTDARSGITNDPNRADDPNYILRLIGQIVSVSVETVGTIKELEKLKLSD